MIKIFLSLLLLASPSFADWHGFALPDYTNPVTLIHPVGVRGFVNGQWLTGYGKDLLFYQAPIAHIPKLYLSVDHLFNAAELVPLSHARGVFGPSVGFSIGGFASKLQQVISSTVNFIHETGGPVILLPPWITNDLDKWVTIETGGGYRVARAMPDVKPWEAWVGGRVTVYFDVTAHH